jgi:transcriptional regulator with XRE-family HTH domain
MDFGQRLAHAMELAGLPKYGGASQLARGIGTTPQAPLQVLKGESKALTAENTARAAKFLKVDWFWLATGEGKPRPYPDEAAHDVARRFAALDAAGQKGVLRRLAEFEGRAG